MAPPPPPQPKANPPPPLPTRPPPLMGTPVTRPGPQPAGGPSTSNHQPNPSRPTPPPRPNHTSNPSAPPLRPASPNRRPGARLPPDTTPPQGPAFLLVTFRDGSSMSGVNPFLIRRWLLATCGEVATAKPIRSGALLIKTLTSSQNTTLLNSTSFAGKAIATEVAVRLNSSQGLIHCPEIATIPEETLLHELSTQGVIEVQRLRSSNPRKPNPLIRLRFRTLQLPDRIFCGYLAVKVRPWIPPPKQCKNCWSFGHLAQTCRRRRPCCGRCAEPHPTSQCQATSLTCPTCAAPHPAWDRSCPAWVEAIRANQPRQPRPNPWATAELPRMPRPLSDSEYPPLPTPPTQRPQEPATPPPTFNQTPSPQTPAQRTLPPEPHPPRRLSSRSRLSLPSSTEHSPNHSSHQSSSSPPTSGSDGELMRSVISLADRPKTPHKVDLSRSPSPSSSDTTVWTRAAAAAAARKNLNQQTTDNKK